MARLISRSRASFHNETVKTPKVAKTSLNCVEEFQLFLAFSKARVRQATVIKEQILKLNIDKCKLRFDSVPKKKQEEQRKGEE